MSFVQGTLIEEAVTPTDKTEVGTTPSWTWPEVETVLSAEWEIGGSTAAIHGLVTDK